MGLRNHVGDDPSLSFRLLTVQGVFRQLTVTVLSAVVLAVFVVDYGTTWLPPAYLAAAVVIAVTDTAYRWLARRAPIGATVALQLVGSLAATAISWWFLGRLAVDVSSDGQAPGWPAVMAVAALAVPAILSGRALRTQAELFYNRRQLSRLVPRITALSAAGVLIAAAVVPAAGLVVALPDLLVIAVASAAAMTGAGLLLMTNYASRFAARPRPGLANGVGLVPIRPRDAAGPAELAADTGVRLVVANHAVQQATITILQFLLLEALVTAIADVNNGERIALVLVLTSAGASLVAAALGLGPGGAVVGRLGLQKAQLIAPTLLVAGVGTTMIVATLGRLSETGVALAAVILWGLVVVLGPVLVWPIDEIVARTMPARLRFGAVSAAGGLGISVGAALAGGLLLVLSTGLDVDTTVLLGAGLAACGAWVIVAGLSGRWYRRALGRRVERPSLVELDLATDTAEAAEVADRLIGSETSAEVILGLDMLAVLGGPAYQNGLLQLASSSVDEVVLVAVVERIGSERIAGAGSTLEALAEAGNKPGVRAAAMKALVDCEPYHGGVVVERFLDDDQHLVRAGAVEALLGGAVLRHHDVAMDQLIDLAESPFVDERAAAARILGQTAPAGHRDLLTTVLADPDPQVRAVALTSVGRLGLSGHTPTVLGALADPRTRRQAAVAVAGLGNGAVPDAAEMLADPDLVSAQAVRILRALSADPAPAGTALVAANIDHKERGRRAAAIAGLVANPHLDSSRLPPDVKVDRLVSPVIDEEAARAVELFEAIDAVPKGQEFRLLERAVRQQAEWHGLNVYRLLAVRYRTPALCHLPTQFGHRGEAEAKARALVDSVASDGHRQLVGSLVGVSRRSRPGHHGPSGDLPRILAACDDDWVAAVAVYGAALADMDLDPILGPDGVIGPIQAATLSWSRRRIIAGESGPPDGESRKRRGTVLAMALVEGVDLLRRCVVFEAVPDRLLVELADLGQQTTLGPGDQIHTAGRPVEFLDVIVAGEVELAAGHGASVVKGEGETIGELAVLHGRPAPIDVLAFTAVELFRIAGRDLRNLLDQHPELGAGVIASLAAALAEPTDRTEAKSADRTGAAAVEDRAGAEDELSAATDHS